MSRSTTVHDGEPQNHTTAYREDHALPARLLCWWRQGGWWKVPWITSMLLSGAFMASTWWLSQTYANRVYPGVSLHGVAIAGATSTEVQHAVEAAYASFFDTPLTVRSGEQVWQPSLGDLGVTIDWERAFAHARAIGASGTPLTGARQLLGMEQATDIPLHMVVDTAAVDAYLGQVADALAVPPQDATITSTHEGVVTTPGAAGRTVLLTDVADAIVVALQHLEPHEITLETQDIAPQITDDEVAQAEQELAMITSAPLDVVVEERRSTLSPETLSTLVEIVQIEHAGGRTLRAQLAPNRLDAYVREITAGVGMPAREPRVVWNDGTLEIVEPGTPGVGVDIEAAITRINDAVRTGHRSVELPLGEVPPRVRQETLNALGIVELIGEGTSSFTDSPAYRVANIKAGVALVHGTLVAPGDEFSFNATIGSISAANGFVEGYALVNNRSQREFGGGICQDSTTLFRAAFYAGLPITERMAHTARLDWYEIGETIGMDAAIFMSSGLDLRFVNDTEHWLVIQGQVDEQNERVTFSIYGTRVPGRRVERSAPSVTELGGGGLYVVVTRTIRQDGEVVQTETFDSTFRPLGGN